MKARNRIPTVFITAALLTQLALPAADAPMPRPDGKPADMSKKVKVFILLGQSNMVGAGKVKGGDGSLEFRGEGKEEISLPRAGGWQVDRSARMSALYVTMSGKGPLNNEWMTVKGNHAGARNRIGHVLGKCDGCAVISQRVHRATGLGWDLLPPGSERREFVPKDKAGLEKKLVYAGYRTNPSSGNGPGQGPQNRNPPPGVDKNGKPIDWYAGKQWDSDIGDAKGLADLGKHYPGAKGYEVFFSGFFFWQVRETRQCRSRPPITRQNSCIHQACARNSTPPTRSSVLGTIANP